MDHVHDEAAAEAAAAENQTGEHQTGDTSPADTKQVEDAAAPQAVDAETSHQDAVEGSVEAVAKENNEPGLTAEESDEEEIVFDLADLSKHIEAIVFASEQPVTVADITDALNRAHALALEVNVVRNHLDSLLDKYQDDAFPFAMVESGGGYRFMSKDAYHQTISHFLNLKSKRRLSTAAMETLAIIAYRQPVTKSEVENIRGVNCDYSIQKLLEKELIEITGRADSPGKPLLYGTSGAFMDYFGINSVEELPKLKEFEQQGDVLGISPEALDAEGAVLPGTASQQASVVEEMPDVEAMPGSDQKNPDATADFGVEEAETAVAESDDATEVAAAVEEATEASEEHNNELAEAESSDELTLADADQEAEYDSDPTVLDEQDGIDPDAIDDTDEQGPMKA